MQMLADLTGMRLEIPQMEETGCLGAALMAMQGVGLDISQVQALNNEMQVFEPNPENYAAYQTKYQRYQKLTEALNTMI